MTSKENGHYSCDIASFYIAIFGKDILHILNIFPFPKQLGVSIWFGFSIFGQNREPKLGYPGSLFWATETRTSYQPVPVVSGLVTGFLRKLFFGLILGIEPKIMLEIILDGAQILINIK